MVDREKRYEAFWAPGLDSEDLDPDDVLEAALKWLASSQYQGESIIVMNAKKMSGNRPLLAWAAQHYRFVSPQSHGAVGPTGVGAVLAVWPSERTLQLAERLATGGSLCVIPGTLYDVSGWIARTEATNLLDPEAPQLGLPELEPEVSEAIRSTCWFGGHNRFLGGDEKIDVVRTLKRLVAAGHRPDPALVEQYAVATGDTSPEGAARLREYYEGVLAGKRYRDYAGRTI